VCLDRELERKAEMVLGVWKNEESRRRNAFPMGKCFNVVPMSNIKSHFVTIDQGVHYGNMSEISPVFGVSREEFTGENRETYRKSLFGFKRLKVSKQKVFTGMIGTDGVATCVRYRRFEGGLSSSAFDIARDEA
jgi:hypothetical protein